MGSPPWGEDRVGGRTGDRADGIGTFDADRA